jgi:hypothetical protein
MEISLEDEVPRKGQQPLVEYRETDLPPLAHSNGKRVSPVNTISGKPLFHPEKSGCLHGVCVSSRFFPSRLTGFEI